MYYVTEYIAKLLGLGHRGRAALRGENGRSSRKALPELGGRLRTAVAGAVLLRRVRVPGRCGAGLRSRRAARTSLLQVRLVFTIFFQTRFTSVAAFLRCSKHGSQTARRCLSPCHATSDSLTA